MVKRTRKPKPHDNLSQMSITNFFTRVKGPAKFDNKPCFINSIPKASTKRPATKKRPKLNGDDEAVSDPDDASLGEGEGRKKKAGVNRRGKKIKHVPSDDEEVLFVREYSMSDCDKAGPSNKEDVEVDLKHLSPEIVLHTDEGDILFSSKLNHSEASDNTESFNEPLPSKNDANMAKDNAEAAAFSSSSNIISSTPLKQISITRSEKQSIELQKRSRVLQMHCETSSNSSLNRSEYVSTDFLPINDTSECDTTLVCESPIISNNTTIVNHVTIVDQTMSSYEPKKNADVDDTFANAEHNENKRKYHLALVDKIVKNANKYFLNNLLHNSDKQLLKEYETMPDNYKFLCCKLFTYTSKWHNLHKFVGKLKLPMGTSEILAMHNHLVAKNIVSKDLSSETSVYLLDLLEADDVKDIHKNLRLKSKKQTKPILVKAILEHSNQQTTLTSTKSLDKIVREKIYDKLGLCVKLSDAFYNMLYKIHLLYSFTNPEFATPSDLYLFMAQIKNEQICLPSFEREEKTFFKDADEFSRFSKACNLKNELLTEFDRKKKSDNMKELCRAIYSEFRKLLENRNHMQDEDNQKPHYLKRFTAGNKYASALTFACKQMTTECPDEVNAWLELLLNQDVFYQQKRGFWYFQHSMVTNRYLKDQEKAAETLVTALKDKRLSLIDLAELTYKARAYCKKKKIATTTQSVREELSSLLCSVPDSNDFPSIVIDSIAANSTQASAFIRSQYKVINPNGDIEYVSVEQVALNHYINEKGFLKGVHCEGSLMTTIFAVLFWDILYSQTVSKQVPFAFISELQYLPLDFSTREFYYNRRAEIEDRLDNIKRNWSLEYLEDYVDTIWNNLSHVKSLIARSIVADSVELSNVILCIGREVVSEVCKRLVEHFREHRAGMPDLFLWNALTKKCKFVEVKGPGDKLSTKQKLWLQFLKSVGADVEVCHVHPIGSNRSQKYKKQAKEGVEF